MSSLHQVANEAGPFILIGPVTVHRQVAPKTAKNGRVYSTVFLKSGGSEMMLSLWDDAAKWKLPLIELTLRGKFVKEQWTDKTVLTCDELSPPEGAVEFDPNDIAPADKPAVKASVKECLEAGVRAADWMNSKKRPELSSAAFTFAANALLQGARLE